MTAPKFVVEVDGSMLPAPQPISSFRYEDDESKAAELSFTLEGPPFEALASGRWDRGKNIAVRWGYHDRLSPFVSAVVRSHGGNGRGLRIVAHAESVLMNKSPKTRSFANLTHGQIAVRVAAEHGYGGSRARVQATERVYEVVSQARLTDAQFLRSLAQKNGFQFWTDGSGLFWGRRDLSRTPRSLFTWESDAGIRILDFTFEGELRAGSVQLDGYDPETKAEFSVQASNDTDRGRGTLVALAEVVDGRTGASLGPRVANNASDVVLPAATTSTAEAEAVAQGRYRDGQLEALKLRLTTAGVPDLAAKQLVVVEGLGVRLSGHYYVKKVAHAFAGHYLSTLDCVRDGYGGSGDGAPSAGAANTRPVSSEDAELVYEVDELGRMVGWRRTP